ncbi:hypothetical protein SteCoe_38682 [Stentor coeruleus]|uniref:Uncharacterized protein n=1 Tax=Stentor coeruleus TaxID=5963 RepID=A0A1R2AL72_9CILI|nr:hypothetical protein SteCoe_38682 [Stentor coeruleus]
MDFKCSVSRCLEDVAWQCNCPEKFKFCLTHSKELMSHSRLKKCLAGNIKDKYLELLAKQYKNALNHVESDCIKLTQEMICEIYNCLKDNCNYLKKKKNEINNLILSEQKNKAETIANWANTLSILQRGKNQYCLSVRKLLGIDNSNIKIVIDWEKLEEELNTLRKNFEESCKKINGLEKELKNSNETNKKLSDAKLKKKYLSQENRNQFSVEEFKKRLSNLKKSDKFKNLLAQLDLQDFQNRFVQSNEYIFKVFISNDNKCIFICEI